MHLKILQIARKWSIPILLAINDQTTRLSYANKYLDQIGIGHVTVYFAALVGLVANMINGVQSVDIRVFTNCEGEARSHLRAEQGRDRFLVLAYPFLLHYIFHIAVCVIQKKLSGYLKNVSHFLTIYSFQNVGFKLRAIPWNIFCYLW